MNEIMKLRQALGLSRKDLGKKLGVSHRTVEGWEQGRKHPVGAGALALEKWRVEAEKKLSK